MRDAPRKLGQSVPAARVGETATYTIPRHSRLARAVLELPA